MLPVMREAYSKMPLQQRQIGFKWKEEKRECEAELHFDWSHMSEFFPQRSGVPAGTTNI